MPLLLLVPTRVGKDDMFVISYKRKLIFYLTRRCDKQMPFGLSPQKKNVHENILSTTLLSPSSDKYLISLISLLCVLPTIEIQ